MTMPTIGGIQRSSKAGPFLFVHVAIAAPPNVAMIWTAPKGMLRRMVSKLPKPKELTMRGPKVVTPPLGILMEKIKANQNHVFKSKQLSVTCSHFQTVETTPV